jgi:hypothetical protein
VLALAALVCACASTAPAVSTAPARPTEVDREALASFVGGRKSEISACYQNPLAQNPKLRGTVVVLFTLTSTGRATEVGIEEDTLQNAAVVSCLTALLQAWDFPFRPAEEVPVAYPFVFSPLDE